MVLFLRGVRVQPARAQEEAEVGPSARHSELHCTVDAEFELEIRRRDKKKRSVSALSLSGSKSGQLLQLWTFTSSTAGLVQTTNDTLLPYYFEVAPPHSKKLCQLTHTRELAYFFLPKTNQKVI